MGPVPCPKSRAFSLSLSCCLTLSHFLSLEKPDENEQPHDGAGVVAATAAATTTSGGASDAVARSPDAASGNPSSQQHPSADKPLVASRRLATSTAAAGRRGSGCGAEYDSRCRDANSISPDASTFAANDAKVAASTAPAPPVPNVRTDRFGDASYWRGWKAAGRHERDNSTGQYGRDCDEHRKPAIVVARHRPGCCRGRTERHGDARNGDVDRWRRTARLRSCRRGRQWPARPSGGPNQHAAASHSRSTATGTGGRAA